MSQLLLKFMLPLDVYIAVQLISLIWLIEISYWIMMKIFFFFFVIVEFCLLKKKRLSFANLFTLFG